jgi:dTDP-glucose pyrophosphorylase
MKQYLFKKDNSIKSALKLLNNLKYKCLIIIDNNQKLLGTLTDGDIRRALVKNIDINRKVTVATNKKPFFLKLHQIKKIKEILRLKNLDRSIKIIPIVNDELNIVKVIEINKFIKSKNSRENNRLLSEVPVVIMAGGKGKRLEKFTELFPKPLLPFKDSTVLEVIINKFKLSGINNFYLTLNYKKNLIKSYLNERLRSLNINYIEERKSLGSAGSVILLKKNIHKDFFVINCDTLLNINFNRLYTYHIKRKNDLSIVATNKNFLIPYGCCILNKNGKLDKILEKKKYSEIVNVGLYVFSPKILNFFKINSKIDMDNLIHKILKKNLRVGIFSINENAWIDTGTLKNITLQDFNLK